VPDGVDSNIPDVVHSKTEGGRRGKTVRIRDVLDKKDGEDVWVVIKGEVYE
jgi:cytochrome b involved in lipid metabolism